MADLIKDATQLVKWRDVPALAIRVSIPNVNLLGTKGSILYGTGKPVTSEASIDGETYQYAEVKALNPTSVKSVLFNDGGGNLSWTNVVDNLTTNDDSKVLSAKVGYDIDSKIHISETTGSGITMGAGASTKYDSSIAIGSNAIEGNNTGFSTILGNSASIDGATDCIAIGNGARISQTGTRRYSSIQLGNGTNTTPYSFQVWNTPMLIDGKIPFEALSPAKNGDVGLVLSNGQTGKDISYDGTVVLGPQAVVTGQKGVAIGAQAVASGNSIAIGGDAVNASSGGIAIGVGAVAGTEGIAIGSTTSADENGIAIGDLASAANETIQLGRSESTFLFRVGNFDVMGKDGQIPGQRLTNALSSIYQRLDDLGFKQGNIVWNSEITMSNVVLNIAHKNSGYDIYKEGKFCYMDTWFRLDVQSGDALYSELSGLIGTLPKEFWPKRSVISPVGNLIKGSNNYSVDMVYVYIVDDGRILVDQRFGYNLVGISATQRNKYLQFGWETN